MTQSQLLSFAHKELALTLLVDHRLMWIMPVVLFIGLFMVLFGALLLSKDDLSFAGIALCIVGSMVILVSAIVFFVTWAELWHIHQNPNYYLWQYMWHPNQ